MLMITSVVGLVCVVGAESSGAGLVDSGVPRAPITMAVLIGAALCEAGERQARVPVRRGRRLPGRE